MSPNEPDEAVRTKWLGLIQRYARAIDSLERARILEELAELLPPGGSARGHAGLEAWLVEPSPSELQASPEYERYRELLPRMLAGTFGPESAEYADFMGLVAQRAERLEEYQDLQEALNVGYAVWREEGAPHLFPTYDFSFLARAADVLQAVEEHTAAIWTAAIDYALEIVVAPTSTLLRFSFRTHV